MSNIVPGSRPRLPVERADQLIKGWRVAESVVLLGIRGYYSTTYGKRGNDRSVYDDAMCVRSPRGYWTFNANLDPSVFRRGIATLQEGVWLYQTGIHGLSKPKNRRYPALVQAAPVKVSRDGSPSTYTGYLGINIHRGGYGTTSSEGCQTIYPDQWNEFFSRVLKELHAYEQVTVPYVLVAEGG
jgi:hypothetical protein